MKKLALALTTTAAAIVGFAAAAEAAPTKVCFVYVGSHTDGGYSQAHDLGRQQIQKEFGNKIETPYLENVPEGPDAERAIERLARSGCSLIQTWYANEAVEVSLKQLKQSDSSCSASSS